MNSFAIERVAKGAAWLDNRYSGWRAKINPDNLYMNTCYTCILGQSLSMEQASTLIWGDIPWATLHGFEADNHVSYDELGAAWKDYLENVN